MTENSNSKGIHRNKGGFLQSYWEQYKYFRLGEEFKYWQIAMIYNLKNMFSKEYNCVDKYYL